MKIQVSFDTPDLEKTLSIAHLIEEHCDIFEVGTILILHHGIGAIKQFRKHFPNKPLLIDTKIVDRGKAITELLAPAHADWISVMAGTGKEVIHSTCTTAHSLNMRVMLDLLDSSSLGQSALEAKNLGADALLFHHAHDEDENSLSFIDSWESVRGNTSLPIFISAKISRSNINTICSLKPDGIIIGHSITEAENPAQEAAFFYEKVHQR